ncbi:hypothetical protein LCGC14_0431300 [marine sediment metagenome]|uniref:Uncharacterized protein n=1 Tax=marine sediment metagenome TaxID=412755 RepID=A0A0F9SN43_9ZZZZ
MAEQDKTPIREQIFKLLFPHARVKRQSDCVIIDQILVLTKHYYVEKERERRGRG